MSTLDALELKKISADAHTVDKNIKEFKIKYFSGYFKF